MSRSTWLEHNPPEDNFDDLDADLDAPQTVQSPNGDVTFLDAQVKFAQYPCERCRGTGRKAGGVCFRCQGSGKQQRRPVDRSPEAVQKRLQVNQKKQDREELLRRDWAMNHAHIISWIESKQAFNRFAQSLAASLQKYGSLTDPQISAVEGAIVDDERRERERKDREAQRAAALAAQATAPLTVGAPAGTYTGLNLRNVPEGHYAVPDGDTRLKIRIDKPTEGKWAGWVFVKDAAVYGQGRRYGMQSPNALYRGDIVDALTKIAADPKAACAAYGRLTGTCGVCGRHLEDAESVARGIGPVCAQRF